MTTGTPLRALVTGAARGIGAATARRLREDGCDVVTLDVSPGCDLTLDVFAGDLDPELFGSFDVVVANAAVVSTVAPSHEMTIGQWQGDIDVNLTGAWRTIRAVLGGMRERRFGRIIAVSSIAAEGGMPNQVAYAASKAGLLGMIRTLAVEQARHGITANAVVPGGIATEVMMAVPEQARAGIVAGIPAGRLGDPAEVAHLISFLASDLAGYVTGEAIGIDGAMGLTGVTQMDS
ncbi:MAG TPA: SDR family NAD(P)-dependent oxidoreductase [Pseudonocardia sp.]|nr:SDR family NAD(P)-dependent oxidoreductase [Pseudonocardia sp.]